MKVPAWAVLVTVLILLWLVLWLAQQPACQVQGGGHGTQVETGRN